MSLPTDNIKDILVSESGLTFATDLFIGRMPESPHDCVVLFDTPGRGPQAFSSQQTDSYDYAAFQLRVRNTAYNTGFALIQGYVKTLHNRGNEMVGSDYVSVITALDSPFLLEWDENDRAVIAVNFEIQRIRAIET